MSTVDPARKIKRRKSGSRKRQDIAFSNLFTRSNRKIIYAGLEAGLPIKRLCETIGMDQTTFTFWMKRGKAYKGYKKYRAFRLRVNKIRDKLEKESIEIIRNAAKGGGDIVETKITLYDSRPKEITRIKKKIAPQWQAAAWWLERRRRDEYGRGNIDDSLNKKTVEEMALEIKNAADDLFNSVP